ncbi:MAG TPA: amino acid racemase, partial [Steroidobacteraceae bacterium]
MTLDLDGQAVPTQPELQSAHRVVGIIGGMGPEATVDLMRRVIAKTPVQDDQDHIHLIVESNPKIPSRIAHLINKTGADPTPELIRIAQNLQRAGAQALAMPCNTAHAYAASIRGAVGIPLLDMVAVTVDRIIALPGVVARVGLLASTAVQITKLYEKAFIPHGIATIFPDKQDELMTLIKAVKRGDTGLQSQAALGRIALEMANQADILLIACSELSVIASGISVPFVDSQDVLAQAVVDFATNRAT